MRASLFRQVLLGIVMVSGAVAQPIDHRGSGMIVGGGKHTLVLRRDGTVWGMGYNSYGQLGLGTTTSTISTPQQANVLTDVGFVAGGGNHSLAIKTNGTLWTWGYNATRQLGHGFAANTNQPGQVSSLSGVRWAAGGENFSAAVTTNGSVWVWGDNAYQQLGTGTGDQPLPYQVTSISNIERVAAGSYHTLALDNGGQVWAWGRNNYGQVGAGVSGGNQTLPVLITNISDVVSIAAGLYHSAALKNDGTVWTWGYNQYGQLGDGTENDTNAPVQVIGISGAIYVDCGEYHTMVVTADGNVWTWGYNSSGQLGLASTDDQTVPQKVTGLTRDVVNGIQDRAGVLMVAAGDRTSVALKSDGTIWTWGLNDYGQMGAGHTTDQSVPVLIGFVADPAFVPTPFNVAVVDGRTTGLLSAGQAFSLALDQAGVVWAWGDNEYKQLGTNAPTDSAIPMVVTNGMRQVAAGRLHALALGTNGTVYAWGYNSSGQLGDGTATSRGVPTQIASFNNVVAVSGGYAHSLALKSDGTVWAWGDNSQGQLGNGVSTDSKVPVPVNGLYGIIAIAAGSDHNLALSTNGTVWAWGENSTYQLGDGTTTDRRYPIKVESLGAAQGIAAGDGHSLVLTPYGKVFGWGRNTDGQVGIGTVTTTKTPTLITAIGDLSWIGVGLNASLAVGSNGTVWVWGDNANYQLGVQAASGLTTPVEVSAIRRNNYQTNGGDAVVNTIGLGHTHVVLGKTDGSAWGSGANGSGQLGDGGATSASLPKLLVGFSVKTNVAASSFTTGSGPLQKLAAGLAHSLAIKSNGTVVAWGDNPDGRLGNNTTTDSIVPVSVSGLTGVSEVAAGEAHSLALVGGAVYAWGANSQGQLGLGDTSTRFVPVAVAGLSTVSHVSAGAYHSIVILNGVPYSWGDCDYGQLGIGSSSGNYTTPQAATGMTNMVHAFAGYRHTLLLKGDGTVWASGNNAYGQLGDGSTAERNTFVRVNGLSGVKSIASGKYHSLALKTDGTVWAWGQNGYGELGQGSLNGNHLLAAQVLDLENVTWIAAGDSYSIAATADGNVWTWGRNNLSQVGDGSVTNHNRPALLWGHWRATISDGEYSVAAIAGGGNHSLALLSDGSLWSWGYNSSGQLGIGNKVEQSSAALVDGYGEYQNSYSILTAGRSPLASGEHFSLALRSDGSVWSWGRNDAGQLGLGTNIAELAAPSRIPGLSNVTFVAAGSDHSLVIRRDGTLWTWGENASRQLGINSTMPSTNAPAQVSIGSVAAVSGGHLHTLALGQNGIVYAWGNNANKQIGDGTTTTHSAPYTVAGITSGVLGIAAGNYHSIVVDSNGFMWAWGDNSQGQIGHGVTGADQGTPLLLTSVSNIIAVAAGAYHSMALRNDGTVWAWGLNSNGEIGNGTKVATNRPAMVNGLRGVVAIDAAGRSSFALRRDSRLWVWGDNKYGQLGDDYKLDRVLPVPIAYEDDVVAIAAGGNGLTDTPRSHTLAMLAGGQVLSWGNNNYGQLGNGSSENTNRLAGDVVSTLRLLKYFATTYVDPLAGGSISRFTTNDQAQTGTFRIGSAAEASSSVTTLDWQKGIALSNDFTRHFPATVTNNLASRWQSSLHYNRTNEAQPLLKVAPLVAFGSLVSSSKLYTGRDYSLRVHFGVLGGSVESSLRIVTYQRSDAVAVATNVFTIPAETNLVSFPTFVRDGLSNTANGLSTTLRLDDFGMNGVLPSYSYSPLVVTHQGASAEYFYEVQGSAAVQTPRFTDPFELTQMANAESKWSRLYVLNFDVAPAWHTEITEVPHATGQPLPPVYYGKSRAELEVVQPVIPTLPPLTNANERLLYLQVNHSPEFRVHPDMTNFVNDLKRDPLALANYVINEIGNTDMLDPRNSITNGLVYLGGLNRGAWGVFQEGQGSPLEQCGLLACLLRLAEVPAVYVFPTNSSVKMLTSRVNDLLGYPLYEDDPTNPTLIPVSFPWVAAWVGERWVHIFPWIKDVKIVRGLNLYDYMPPEYDSGYKWMIRFMESDTNIVEQNAESDQPLVLWPKFVEKMLLNHPGISMDDVGIQQIKRSREYQDWETLPRPFAMSNDVAILESLSTIPEVFNQVEFGEFSTTSGLIKSRFLIADLHNRPITIALANSVTGGYKYQMRFAAIHSGAFGPADLPVSAPLGMDAWAMREEAIYWDTATLPISITYDTVAPIYVLGHPQEWGRRRGIQRDKDKRTMEYNAAGSYGLSINVGRVTKRMLDVHAHEIWKHRDEVEGGGSADKAIYRGLSMFLMGQTYWEYTSRFAELNYRLHGIRPVSSLGHLAAFIQPGSSGKYEPRVDVPYVIARFVQNPDLPGYGSGALTASGYGMLAVAQGSAAEHGIVSTYLQDTNAVSTYKLLQKLSPEKIVRISPDNYQELGEKEFENKKLREFDPEMWKSVVSAMSAENALSEQTQAFLTPGNQTNGTFKGMGGLILQRGTYSALISGLNNGGAATQVPTSFFTWGSNPSFDLIGNTFGSFSLTFDNNSYQHVPFVTSEISLFNVDSYFTKLTTEDQFLDPYTSGYLRRLNSSYNVTFDSLIAMEFVYNSGTLPKATSFGDRFITFVSDPVSVITGEFYVEDVDLRLPGPMPLEIRRTYSSHNESAGLFGFGWQIGYMPFITINTNNDTLYAAEMDGSVVAYSPVTSTLWRPTSEHNPRLNNRNQGVPGSVGNLMNGRIELSITNSLTNYFLFGPDGSVRHYLVQQYPVRGTNSSQVFDRTRPYLQKWTDNRGNSYSFSFGQNSNRTDYGQLRRVEANNGNYVGFYYDSYGHIVEAFTGDGRRLKYEYDTHGDLTAIIRPDGSEFTFEYEHKNVVTNASSSSSVQVTNYYSTHLLTRQIKPDGRVLLNEYDAERRVTNQWSTVGPDLRLVHNATFIYSNDFVLAALTNEFAGTNTINGFTTVIDVNANVTHYAYTNGLLRLEIDALNRTNITDWYLPGDASVGAYPRSVKRTVTPRGLETVFKYDSNGNLTNSTVTGDLTGFGYVTNAISRYEYDSRNLLTNVIDAVGNRVVNYMDSTYPYLPAATVAFGGGAVVSSNVFEYYDVIDGTTNSFGLLRRRIVAAGTADAATNQSVHDARGFITQEIGYSATTDPDLTNFFRYTARGEIYEQRTTASRTNRFDYDGMGRVRGKEVFDESGRLLATDYTYYNDNGEVVWSDGPKYDPEDYVWRDYDGFGRLIEEVRWRARAKSDGTGVEAYIGEELFSPSFQEYDTYGNHTRSTDAYGRHVDMGYDAVGQMLSQRAYDSNGTLLSTNGYKYEVGGEVSEETNPLGGITRKFYTSTGKVRRQENPDGSVLEWRYLVDGRVQREIQPNGAYWETTYDDANRKTTRIFKDAGNTAIATNIQYLDRRGNAVTNVDLLGNTFVTTYDGLNRVKSSRGPGPNVQSTTHLYDGSGRIQIVTNALGEQTYTFLDALGRPLTNEVRTSGGTMVRRTTTSYATNHHSVTTVEGTDANVVKTTTWSDTFGKPVLTQRFTDSSNYVYTLGTYDFVGNLASSQDEIGQASSFVYDGLNRLSDTLMPDGAIVSLKYNAAGSITNRTMPGGLIWSAVYDSANRITSQRLTGGALTSRISTYSYYSSGPVGLPYQITDPRNNVSTLKYDVFLRLTNSVVTGAQTMTNRLGLDLLGRLTNSIQLAGTNVPVEVSRRFDPYGQVTNESVRINGVLAQQFAQQWDTAGRRTNLAAPGNWFNQQFSYRADGLMSQIRDAGANVSTFAYGDNGLLASSVNPWRTLTVHQRDGLGRRLSQTAVTAQGTAFAETNVWRGNSTLAAYTSRRLENGGWLDSRGFGYNLRNHLTNETFSPKAGQSANNAYAFDAAKLGVRTSAFYKNGTSSNTWVVPSGKLDGLAQILQEDAKIGLASLRADGRVANTNQAWITLDGVGLANVRLDEFGFTNRWSADVEAASGSHTLKATVFAPLSIHGYYSTTNTFSVAASTTTTNQYDAAGNVIYRRLGTVMQQTLGWDAANRLTAIYQTDGTNGFSWSALYDGMGRRLRTHYTAIQGGTNLPLVTEESWFDPQVEFQEVAVVVNGQRTWKTYGPDRSESYGGAQGIGGLESTRRESDGVVVGTVHDQFGTIVANMHSSSLLWNPNRYTGYGPAQGYQPPTLSLDVPVNDVLVWQGRRIDPNGYYWMGARYYDPRSGRFLSPDPLGHESCLDLYSFANGDPINFYDPDGRLATGAYKNGLPGSRLLRWGANYLDEFSSQSDSSVLGAGAEFASHFMHMGAAMGTPSTFVNQGITDYEAGGAGNVINRYNPLRAPFQAVSGLNLMEGQGFGEQLSGVDRAVDVFNTVGLVASAGAATLVSLERAGLTTAVEASEISSVTSGLGVGGTGYSLNPIEWFRNYQIMNRARDAGINVVRTLDGQSASLINGQPTAFVSPFASSTVAMEEFLHARFLQIVGPDRAAQLLRNPVAVLSHEVRLKNLMINAGKNGTLGSSPLAVDIDFLINTRIGYSAELNALIGRTPK